jgi:hypothetical protein
MSTLAKHNVTTETPSNVMLGAGIVVSNLQYQESGWTYDNVFGATSGGSTFKIEPELIDIEVDGVTVGVAQLKQKVGEKATLETNLAEVTSDNLAMLSIGAAGAGNKDFDEIVSSPSIPAGAFVENLGFIGYTVTGDPIVILMDKALCTSGLELGGENKKQATAKATFECLQDIAATDLTILPWHIYTKKN